MTMYTLSEPTKRLQLKYEQTRDFGILPNRIVESADMDLYAIDCISKDSVHVPRM